MGGRGATCSESWCIHGGGGREVGLGSEPDCGGVVGWRGWWGVIMEGGDIVPLTSLKQCSALIVGFGC